MLTVGTKLGPYEIEVQLGAGGMGEVYRARDTRLDRTVAIKVLPSHLSQNEESKQRFEREARAISSLSHPNICALYDVGVQDGAAYLVMEYLEGETLADRLRQGPLPPPELTSVAIEVGDALDKAHRQGIVHRDLKPGNIMLTKSGSKLMDFGLAKGHGAFAAAGGLSGAATLTTPLTTQGNIVGTFHYMSPEQVEGRDADPRSDIFAMGAVLYEMATGRRAFEGKSQIAIAGSILEKDPEPVSQLQPTISPELERVISRCLAKDPDERWQTARDLTIELKYAAGLSTSTARALPAPPKPASRAAFRLLPWAAAGLLLVSTLGFAWLYLALRAQPLPVVRSYIQAPEKVNFSLPSTALSPDGRLLAFVANQPNGGLVLWVRPLSSLTAQPLAGTEGANFPFWSPDSRRIGYFANGKLRKVDAAGGPPQTLCDATAGRGGTWNEDDVILFSPGVTHELQRVPAAGGTPSVAVPFDAQLGDNGHRWPQFLPDGRHFIFWVRSTHGADSTGIYLGTLGAKEHRLLVRNDSGAAYASGHLLYVREQTLVAQPFDPRKLQLTGEAVPLAEGVGVNGGIYRGMFSASQTGVLSYFAGESVAGWPLAIFDRNGKPGGPIFPESQRYTWPRFSPEGKRLAVAMIEGSGANKDIWVIDLQRGTRTRLTFEPSAEDYPMWAPDGARIYYGSNRKGQFHIYSRATNNLGGETTVLETSGVEEIVMSISRDGRYLAYHRAENGKKYEVWILPLFGDPKPFPLVQTQFTSVVPQFSPDGKWVAYMSDETGTFEVYLTPFPGGGGKFQVSTHSGTNPVWAPDGKRLYFLDNTNHVMAVDAREAGSSVELGTPTTLFTHSSPLPGTAGPLEVAPDGRILINGSSDQTSANRPMTLVVNWPAELKK